MLRALLFVTLAAFSVGVLAGKECRKKTDKIYTGDNGSLWMVFVGGGTAFMSTDDPDFGPIYSMVLAAQMGGKEITVRYAAEEVDCNSGTRSDIVGVWLHK